jgi:siphovirus family protein
MTLYEIDAGIAECIDEETGEIVDFEKLDALQMEREKKIENIVWLIENTENEIAGLKEQEEIFKARRQAAEKKQESLKGYLTHALKGEKFETVKAKVSFRKSEAVIVEDEVKVPKDYWVEKVTEGIDLTAIKNALKAGKSVEGARIEERLNPQINSVRRA